MQGEYMRKRMGGVQKITHEENVSMEQLKL